MINFNTITSNAERLFLFEGNILKSYVDLFRHEKLKDRTLLLLYYVSGTKNEIFFLVKDY